MKLNVLFEKITAAKRSYCAFIFHEIFVPVNGKITLDVNKSNFYMA